MEKITKLTDYQNELMQVYLNNNMALLKRSTKNILNLIGIKINEVDYDDFYSIANMTLWQAIIEYDNSRTCTFNTFLNVCLMNKFKSEIRNRGRYKRKANYNSVSLDGISNNLFGLNFQVTYNEWLYSYDMSYIEKIYSTYNYHSKNAVEIKAISNMMLENIIVSINDEQLRIITKLLILGYRKRDIKKYLDINDYLLSKKISQIKRILNLVYK